MVGAAARASGSVCLPGAEGCGRGESGGGRRGGERGGREPVVREGGERRGGTGAEGGTVGLADKLVPPVRELVPRPEFVKFNS
jgi:hypothetical protein